MHRRLILLLILFPLVLSAEEVKPGDKDDSHPPDAVIVTPVKKKALYELGFGGAAFWGADYPASDEYRWNALAVPYFAYRGEVLRMDREEGLRALFAEEKKWEFDVSLGAAFPANSKDNEAREGMNDLSWIGEVGPQLPYYFLRDPIHLFRLSIP